MAYARTRKAALAMGLGVLAAWLAATGCEDEDDLPVVTITSPSAGSTHDLSDSAHMRVAFETDDFEIEEDCGDERGCGMAYLNIDGGACNQPGQEYNNVLLDADTGENRELDALFEQCPAATRIGAHTITISLRFRDGSMVPGEGGQPATAAISVTTTP